MSEKPLAIVTGATSGIGLVTARELATRGYRVIVVGRSAERMRAALESIRQAVPAADIDGRIADLSLLSAVRQLAADLPAVADHIDLLVNNVGALFMERSQTAEGLEATLALNHLGPFLLTNLLLPQLRNARPPRIVNVASEAHRVATLNLDDLQMAGPYRGFRAYANSKLCNILFTRDLSRRLEGQGPTVNALHPGFVRSEFFSGPGPSKWLMRQSARIFGIKVDQGATNSLFVGCSAELNGVTGRYFVRKRAVDPSAAARDDVAASRLWELSCRLCGLG